MRFDLEWQGRIYEDDKPYFPASVPGNIQYDWAVNEGFADDIMYGTTARRFLEVEDCFWEYRTVLNFERKDNRRVYFVAEGIDYIFDILLDGVKIYSHEGMFTLTRLDITDKAVDGSLLQVIIHPHPKLEGMPADRNQASQSCKPPSVYEWDWNPRLLISGIWMPAYIEVCGDEKIESCEPFYELNDSLTSAEVSFETVCASEVTYTVKDMEGNTVYSGSNPKFTLDDINLWWCSGQGTPYLYSWTASSCGDTKSGRIGFRTIRLVKNGGAGGSDPDGFPKSRYPVPATIELNGRRIFAKGSNWVNPELFFGRITEERYREELTAAVDANMNILRLWGGSGIKKPEFYDICDELGILIWQEFMLACNNYKGTKSYLKILEQEASFVIKNLRRHPCIAFWCGGNELFNSWSGMTDQSHALRLLNKLCYELDFDRPYIMTSPLTGMKHGCYLFDDGKQQVYEMFQKANGIAYSEFGVPATPSVDMLKKIIPEDELFPVNKTESWVYHHAFGAWGDERWICLDVVRKYFGEPGCIDDIVNATQWMQCEGYKAIFEEARRQWPVCSMAINWCYNEPWITAANNSLLAYPCVKKPAYYSVKESLRPVLASARIPKFDWRSGEDFSAELWLLNDSDDTVSDEITASVIAGGKEYILGTWKTDDIRPRSNAKGPDVSLSVPEVLSSGEFILKLKSLKGYDSEYRLRFIAD